MTRVRYADAVSVGARLNPRLTRASYARMGGIVALCCEPMGVWACPVSQMGRSRPKIFSRTSVPGGKPEHAALGVS